MSVGYESLAEHILDVSIPEPNTGCWLFVNDLGRDGYGYITSRNRKKSAHRASYEAFVGMIPKGLYILHSCAVKSCVNPRHLRAGTHQENMDDRKRQGRTARGAAFPHVKFTEDDVRTILRSPVRSIELARQFGVSRSSINSIRARRFWKHVELN